MAYFFMADYSIIHYYSTHTQVTAKPF